MLRYYLLNFIFLYFVSSACKAQEVVPVLDSLIVSTKNEINLTDSVRKKNSPQKIAALRSAILPGLGQIYNKKYWKLPFVYGALGTTAVVFVYNLNNYKDLKLAYKVKYNIRVFRDSTDYHKVSLNLLPLSEESLRFNRDQFRQSLDYTVLFFIAFWGLNVVDAAVDAHLKSFDISPDLSLKIKFGHSELAGTNGLNVALLLR